MGRLKINGTFTGNKVPRLTRFLYPFSGIFRDACYALVGSFLLQYALTSGVLSDNSEVFAAQYGVITVAMMVALVWDGINDPIMGFIVEKVHFKLGKFKPWILIGAIGNALAVLLLFLVRPGGDGWAYVVLMIVFYVLWDTFFTMNDIGYWAMLPSLTNDDKERASLTSHVSICAAIGGFLMTAMATLLPGMLSGVATSTVYAILAIAISILFLVSQAAIFFLCQERARDEAVEEASEKSSLVDLFKVIVKNPQLRIIVICMFLYYLANGVITGGIGLNYYYLSVGYGGNQGGLVVTLISVFYVAAMIGSQALYPILAKKIAKKKILLLGTIVALVGALGFFFTCFPIFSDTSLNISANTYVPTTPMDFGWAFGGMMWCNYLFPFLFFFGAGTVYMVILVMFQDSIDYDEYRFGDRKESLISAWRPLTVKLGSALLRGIQFLVFLTAGVMTTVNGISTAEQTFNAEKVEFGDEIATEHFKKAIADVMESVTAENLRIIGLWIVIILVACFVAVFVIIMLNYKISEEKHLKIVEEIEKRHAEGE
ncbi:MAG: MFS transporter, partial [Bacilli bacterium]|nr:MFS transporter [Bacilli bacterium]